VRERTRIWVLPLVFALAVLLLPLQQVLIDRFGEPYPGLTMPWFTGTAQVDGRVKLTAVTVEVDGRRVDPRELQAGRVRHARLFLSSMFPVNGGEARLDTRSRTAIRSTLPRGRGFAPRTLVVTWDRRWFHLGTGEITRGRMLSQYRVDLRDVQ
jgi:hypothetical protein